MKSLRELYQENKAKLEEVRESFKDEVLGGPLLMELDSYYKQPIKLLIVGQQTKGWGEECDYKDHDCLLDVYRAFNMGTDYYSSPFWSFTRGIEDMIGIERYSCAWSNINKYDHNGKEPKDEILAKIRDLDYLLAEEISIIQPDVCFFFTNKKYDDRLEELYSGIEMDAIDGLPDDAYDTFVSLQHSDLPKYSFRTPHPRPIRTGKTGTGVREPEFMKAMKRILPKINDV